LTHFAFQIRTPEQQTVRLPTSARWPAI